MSEDDGNRFFQHLKEKARTMVPDYPFTRDDPWEDLWAITSSLEGITMANNDCHKMIRLLVNKLGLSTDDYLRLFKEAAAMTEHDPSPTPKGN